MARRKLLYPTQPLEFVAFSKLMGDTEAYPAELVSRKLKANNKWGLPPGIYDILDYYPEKNLLSQQCKLQIRRDQAVLVELTLDAGQATQALQFGIEVAELAALQAWTNYILDLPSVEAKWHERLEQLLFKTTLGEKIKGLDPSSVASLSELEAFLLGQLEELMGLSESDSSFGKGRVTMKFAALSQKERERLKKQSLIVRLDLLGAPLKIWRRLSLPADLTLAQLHDVIQTAMGWHNCHLWAFSSSDQAMYGPDDNSPDQILVGQVLHQVGQKLAYTYDFGDDWHHSLKLEKILDQSEPLQVLKAVGACPPEDCGGVWGYAELLQALGKKRRTAYDKELLEAVDDDFDPQQISIEDRNRSLVSLVVRWQPKPAKSKATKVAANKSKGTVNKAQSGKRKK